MSSHDSSSEPYNDLPDDMKRRAQFVVWKLEIVPGRDKPTKVPHSPVTGAKASSTNSTTWGTFDQAMTAYLSGKYDGIGFVFSSGDPYVFIDLDDAFDPIEAERLRGLGLTDPMLGFKAWVAPWITQLAPLAYLARSQSGSGAHIILNGKLPGKGGKRPVIRDGEKVGMIEMYNVERFVALTGKTLSSGTLTPAQPIINQVYAHFGFAPKGQGAGFGDGAYNGDVWSTGLTDDQVITLARRAKNGAAFEALCDNGDISAYGNDHSRADFALVEMLAFYCGPNPPQIDRLFRKSKLFRPKWDEQRGDSTYGERTIGNALRERGTDRSDYFGRNATSNDTSEDPADPDRFRILYDDEIEDMPAPSWLVQDYLLTDTLAGIYGPSEAGKTFTGLDLTMCVNTGEDFHGKKVRQGVAVYAAAEGAAGMGARVKAWKKERGLTGRVGVGFMFDEVNFLNDSDREGFIARLRELPTKPSLVVIDTFAWAMAGGDENSVKDVMRAMEGIKKIRREFGATVLTVHHTTKDGDRERGSSSFRNGMDTMLKQTQDKGVITLEVTKQKDAPKPLPRQFRLKVVQLGNSTGDGDDLTLDLNTSCVLEDLVPDQTTAQIFLLNDKERTVLDALRMLNDVDGPVSTSAWQKASDVSEATFYRVRPPLIAQGYVEVAGNKRYRITDRGRDALAPVTFYDKETRQDVA